MFGIVREMREFLRVSRKLLDGSVPCDHQWIKIAEIREKPQSELIAPQDEDSRRVNVVTMCTHCGDQKETTYGPPYPPPPPPAPPPPKCQHVWKDHDTLEEWVQPMKYERTSGKQVPSGEKFLKAKVYVRTCEKCGELTQSRVKVQGA